MSSYIINGGSPLFGEVAVSGGKNAVLPLLSAALLCSEGEVTLSNCPCITDVTCTLSILETFGCAVSFANGQIKVNAEKAVPAFLPLELCSALRSASLFLGAALGRFGYAAQTLPGGCKLGSRPINLHLDAFSKMGVSVKCEYETLICENSPHSTDIFLSFPSVGATENIILASALSEGTTTVSNAAREPEITELCNFITAMGGNIRGGGSSLIIIQGVEKLRGINYNVMGDRIEAATFLALALATDGEITVSGAQPGHLSAFTDVLVNCGGTVCISKKGITARRSGHFLLSPGSVNTGPYPAFPTDAQTPLMAMLLKANGESVICERIFDGRLKAVNEFIKMGADITVCDNTATIRGVPEIFGADLVATDLRSGAALVIAALSAEGLSTLSNVCYIERGYSDFVSKLHSLGADITKTKDV